MAIFHSNVSHYQRVNLHFPMVFLWFSYGFPMVFPLKPPLFFISAMGRVPPIAWDDQTLEAKKVEFQTARQIAEAAVERSVELRMFFQATTRG